MDEHVRDAIAAFYVNPAASTTLSGWIEAETDLEELAVLWLVMGDGEVERDYVGRLLRERMAALRAREKEQA